MSTGRLARFAGLCLAAAVAGSSAVVNGADRLATAYTDTIRPLLAEQCFSCHGGLKQEAGLRLDTVGLMTEGGESGGVVVHGDPDNSLIFERVSDPDPATRMPPEGEGLPFSAEQIALLRDWIKAGCPAPPDEKPEADPREHWAFQPRVRPDVPAVTNTPWVKNPIDAFLAAAHEQAGVTPQPEAPRPVLVRRLFIDLIGLPPQPEELAAIEADTSVDWYEKLVEKLLADPRHGERWARHWMDVWRYADWWGLGEQHRNSAKHLWRFRDWIVESLNADTGYDEMLRQMLAADELYPDDPGRLRATGFLARNWYLYNRDQWLDETVEHVGKGLLGLTMNCAKCHAHKYDPIQQEDFYRFRAFFEPYSVRVDVVAGEADPDLDGMSRIFDGYLDKPTYLFVRGDDSKPDTSKKIEPAVPEVIACCDLPVQPVSLPKTAFEPERQPWVIDAYIGAARRRVEAAEVAVVNAVNREESVKTALAAAEYAARSTQAAAAASGPAAPGSFVEDFASLDADRWTPCGGEWKHEPGRLVQGKDGQTRSVLRLVPTPPRDFDATVTFTITGGGTYRSVGLAFDSSQPDPVRPHGVDDREVSVYSSGWTGGPKVQASYLSKDGWQYPADAAAARKVGLNSVHTLRVAVRDTLVNVWFDGEQVIAWRSPVPRRDGSLQLTTFDATAVFQRVSLDVLSGDVPLREPSTAAAPSLDAARADLALAGWELVAARGALAVERAVFESVVRRAQATRVAWETEGDAAVDATAKRAEAAQAAVRAEREVVAAKARQQVTAAEDKLAKAAAEKKDAAALAAVEKELAAAREAVEKAVQAGGEPGDQFTPFVGAKWLPTRFKSSGVDDPAVPFAATSTGRRSALARWITDPRNPLTARVAANHIWMRHMGRPLVSTVFDFGRKGNAPVHPELLDWLASELVDGRPSAETTARGWSMKHLHRLICTSAAYRMGSSTAAAEAALRLDPDNRLLWRREPMRLEAQVVRDGILAVGGMLDTTIGGPPVPGAQQAASRRRSLYFWHSDISRNLFLAMFDDAAPKECYQRDQSIVPQQALALSNSAFVHEAAVKITERIQAQVAQPAQAAGAAVDDNENEFLDRAFLAVLLRRPSADERDACLGAIGQWRALAPPRAAGVDPVRIRVVWALLNHNDFVTLR